MSPCAQIEIFEYAVKMWQVGHLLPVSPNLAQEWFIYLEYLTAMKNNDNDEKKHFYTSPWVTPNTEELVRSPLYSEYLMGNI